MDLELKGKRMLITGGSIGIGLAVAQKFAEEGADIAIGARNIDNLNKAAEEISSKYNVKCLAVQMDVTKADNIDKAAEIIEEEFGVLDILINNAGAGSEETVINSEDDKWYHYWDLHVMAAVRTSRAFVKLMKKAGGGVILNTASICAIQPLWYEPIYNTTKAALVMFGKCLSNELIKDNIRVNTINPGLVLTPDWKKTANILCQKEGITADEYLDRIAKENTPIGRFASPEEISNIYAFLASPKASYCVGSSYYIDGGWLKVIN